MRPGIQADIVREFGCTRTAISKLVKAKDYRIIYTPGKKINVEATVKALKDSGFGKRSKKQVKKTEEKKQTQTTPASLSDLPTQEEVDCDPLKPTDERSKIEKYLSFQKYEKERIANEKSKNELIRLDDITNKIFDVLRPLRDDLQAFSKRNAPIIHMSESRHEAVKISQEEIDRILLSRIGGEYIFDDALKKKIVEMLTK